MDLTTSILPLGSYQRRTACRFLGYQRSLRRSNYDQFADDLPAASVLVQPHIRKYDALDPEKLPTPFPLPNYRRHRWRFPVPSRTPQYKSNHGEHDVQRERGANGRRGQHVQHEGVFRNTQVRHTSLKRYCGYE